MWSACGLQAHMRRVLLIANATSLDYACRWRNFLSPDIEHPRKSPFSEWEVAVVVQVSG